MDPDADMLASAREKGEVADVNVRFLRGGWEDLSPAMGPFRLVMMGRSFHWMDRAATLAMLEKIVTPDGAVALFHDAHPPVKENDWFKILCEVQAKYRQERRHGGHKRYEPFLFASAFTEIDTLSVTIRQSLTVEDIVGRAFSMSASSRERLGAAQEEFRRSLSEALQELSADGKFIEVAELVAVLARRPDR